MKNLAAIILSVIFMTIMVWILFEINKTSDDYLYGKSFRQNAVLNTVRLHNYKITGRGVTVGVLGAGFYTLHPVFEKTKIVKEFDFVTEKPTTINFEHIKGMDHGTSVLSVIGGYKENELIGIAYDANFILAKTDISGARLFEEELIAVKGSKWLFDNGADIITTSLSFNRFEDAYYYTPDQMDGNTSLISKTADSLSREGVVYISSAGNNYKENWHIIETPGDGFNILTVGSVNKELNHSWFSSCGPTADGRIKPDLAAPGESVWTANYLPNIKPDFWWNHGTSISAPLVAGIAALVLSTHPELSSEQVIEAIKMTASKSADPDNLFGWGIPDAEKAVSYFGPAFSNIPIINYSDDEFEISTYVFSSYGLNKESVKLHLIENDSKKVTIYNMNETENDYYSKTLTIKSKPEKIRYYFQASDSRGNITKYPSGILGDYFTLN
jgi:subtilisin family serine protease